MTRPLRAVLIAGGGPVGLRVVRACKELGIRSIVPWVDADPLSALAQHADEAVPLETGDVAALIEVARSVGADAVHPGDTGLASSGAHDLVWIGGPTEVRTCRDPAPGERRVAVQVLADAVGGCVAVGAWDRSLGSVVEASALTPQLADAAVAATRASGGVGVCTCRFLLDRCGRFDLEQVTGRLEPEHAVAEGVTGLDLVHWQLDIAAGGTLSGFVAPAARGAAIGCRITGRGPGRVAHLQVPSGPGVRWDGGIEVGSLVSGDAALGMLTVWAPTRTAALARMRRALTELGIAGIETSRELQLRILADPEVERGGVDARWITRAPLADGPPPETLHAAALAAALLCARDRPRPGVEPAGSDWARAARLDALRRR